MSTAKKTTGPLLAAITAVNKAVPQDADEKSLLIAAKCRALITGYTKRYLEIPYRPLKVEQTIRAPLLNPSTGRRSRTFTLAGKIDVDAEYYNRTVIIDGKSTSNDITDPNGSFWSQLVVEAQPSHYMFLKWLRGEKVDDCVWDVMRKPGISPKQLTKAELHATVKTGDYFGTELSGESLKAVQLENRETLEMYELRLVRDCTITRPEHYFQRRSVPRLDKELLDYGDELWEHGQEILHARNTGRHARNSGACMLYGSPCEYLGICSSHDTPNSGRWQQRQQVHVELPELKGDGRNVITNSRVRCFQTCRRKHYYRYELGIERRDKQEREALLFGTVWHVALEAWWSYLQEQSNGNRNESSPLNEGEQHLGAGETTFAS